mgnify:CR=1 FL=1
MPPSVTRLHGDGFVLLGNAAEFLDPVFSSGVTIAMQSASLAAHAIDRQLQGETVDWSAAFDKPLKYGVETFRAFVNRLVLTELFRMSSSTLVRRNRSAATSAPCWPVMHGTGQIRTRVRMRSGASVRWRDCAGMRSCPGAPIVMLAALSVSCASGPPRQDKTETSGSLAAAGSVNAGRSATGESAVTSRLW